MAPTLDRILEDCLYSREDVFEGAAFLDGLDEGYWNDLIIGKMLSINDDISSAPLSWELSEDIKEAIGRFLWILVESILGSGKEASALNIQELVRLTPIRELHFTIQSICREIFEYIVPGED